MAADRLTIKEREALKKQMKKAIKKLRNLGSTVSRQERLTENDPQLRELRNQLLATCQQVSRIGGKDKYTDHGKVYGYVLTRTKKGNKPRKVVIDWPALGMTRREGKAALGGTDAKHLNRSSVQFTWRVYNEKKGGDDAFEYRGLRYAAADFREYTVTVPFKVFQRFVHFIDLDHDKRGGIIAPGTVEHWLRVSTSLVGGDFAGSQNVEEFTGCVNNYICKSYDADHEDVRRPHETVIRINNIRYHNLNSQQPTTPVDQIPYGFLTAALSNRHLQYKVKPADTWEDFFEPERVPADMKGFVGICLFVGLFNAVHDSFEKRKKSHKAINTPKSTFRTDMPYMWDVVKNRPKTGPIYDKNNRPIFLPKSHPEYRDYKTTADRRTTLEEAKLLFELFFITARVLDEHGAVIWRCDRKKDPAYQTRSTVEFVAKNGHLYLCPNKEEDSEQGRYHQNAVTVEDPVACNDRFKVAAPRKEVADNRHRILTTDDWRTIPDLVAKTVSTTDKPVVNIYVPSRAVQGKRGRKAVRYENDLFDLFCLFKEKGMEAEIQGVKDRAYGMLRLRNFVTPNQPSGVSVTIQALSPNITTIEEEDALIKARVELDRRIFIKRGMSSFNQEGIRSFKKVDGGLIGCLCDDPAAVIVMFGAQKVWEVDIRAQHPYALSKIRYIPIYSVFDYPQTYDEEKYVRDFKRAVEPYTSYEVDFYVPNHLYRSQGICSGLELLWGYKKTDYKIRRYFRPSCLVPSHIFPEMANFMEKTTLDERIAKAASVPVCGSLGKQYNKKVHVTHFPSSDVGKQEALHYKRRYKGVAFFQNLNGVDYYAVAREQRVELTEGFRPTYFMEQGLSRYQQFANIQQISKKAVVLHSVTDAVRFLFPNNAAIDRTILQHQQTGQGGFDPQVVLDYLGLGDQMVDKSLPYRQQVGKLKVLSLEAADVRDAYTSSLPARYQPADVDNRYFAPIHVPTKHTYYLPDEYDPEGSLEWVLKQTEVSKWLFVKGLFPGVGKSALARALAVYIKAEGGRVIVLSQYWETAMKYKDIADKVSSLYSAFSIAPNGEDLSQMEEVSKGKGKGTKTRPKKKGIDFSTFSLLVVDEIFTADLVSLQKIAELRAKYPDLIVVSNGDVGQLPPVNTGAVNNVPEHLRQSYYTTIIDRMFPHQLMLTKVKRARCAKHQDVYTLPEIRDCLDCQAKSKAYVDRVEAFRRADNPRQGYNKMITMFKTIDRLDAFEKEGITTAVSYTNSTAEVVNTVIHKTMSKKAGHPGKLYWEGMTLIAKKNMWLGQVAGIMDEVIPDGELELETASEEEYDDPKKRIRVYTNHLYKVIDVKPAYILVEDTAGPVDGVEPVKLKVTRTKRKGAYQAQVDHFRLPYCRTGHSFQGDTINEKFCIMEADYVKVILEWLVVACTRNVDPDSIYVYVGQDYKAKKKEVDDRKLRETAVRELEWHKKSDMDAFGSLEEGEGDHRYPTVDEYVALLMESRGSQCPHPECMNVIGLHKSEHSWDRLNGGVRHWISNCRFLCSMNCNSSLRPSYGL